MLSSAYHTEQENKAVSLAAFLLGVLNLFPGKPINVILVKFLTSGLRPSKKVISWSLVHKIKTIIVNNVTSLSASGTDINVALKLCFWACVGIPQSWHTAGTLSWPERDVPLFAEVRHSHTIPLAKQQHWTETTLNPSVLLPLSHTTFSSFLHGSTALMGRKKQNLISSFIMLIFWLLQHSESRKKCICHPSGNWNPVFHILPVHLIIQ